MGVSAPRTLLSLPGLKKTCFNLDSWPGLVKARCNMYLLRIFFGLLSGKKIKNITVMKFIYSANRV
jgi:hypothetical protein